MALGEDVVNINNRKRNKNVCKEGGKVIVTPQLVIQNTWIIILLGQRALIPVLTVTTVAKIKADYRSTPINALEWFQET